MRVPSAPPPSQDKMLSGHRVRCPIPEELRGSGPTPVDCGMPHLAGFRSLSGDILSTSVLPPEGTESQVLVPPWVERDRASVLFAERVPEHCSSENFARRYATFGTRRCA